MGLEDVHVHTNCMYIHVQYRSDARYKACVIYTRANALVTLRQLHVHVYTWLNGFIQGDKLVCVRRQTHLPYTCTCISHLICTVYTDSVYMYMYMYMYKICIGHVQVHTVQSSPRYMYYTDTHTQVWYEDG